MRGAALLRERLTALQRDPGLIPARVLRDLQRVCTSCGHKTRCMRDLAGGSAETAYQDYCPNADMLRVLRPWMEKSFRLKISSANERPQSMVRTGLATAIFAAFISIAIQPAFAQPTSAKPKYPAEIIAASKLLAEKDEACRRQAKEVKLTFLKRRSFIRECRTKP